MSNKQLLIEDIITILHRRKFHLAIPVFIILLLTGALAYILPPLYVSTATILIEQQDIPEDLVDSMITGYVAERIEKVRNRVMTGDNLWAIAEKFNLYPNERSIESKQDITMRIREDISMAMVNVDAIDPRSGKAVTPTIAFTVSYGNESPELAQTVTAYIAELYLNENRRSRTENVQQTSSFLDGEAKRLQKQITDLESEIAVFKVKNAGYLPESFEVTSRSLDSSQQQLGMLDAKLSPLESRHTYLRSQLAGLGSSAQLAKVRAELAAAREKYSDLHPDVVRLKRTVDTLETEANRSGSSTVSPASGDPEYLALQSELQQVAGEIGSVHSQRAELNRKIADYQSRLAQSPEVERKFSALTRDLDHATNKYLEIKDKQASARLAVELEREKKAERFTLIEAASYPSAPSEPNVPAIMLLGLTLALAAGVGIASLAEYLDHRIHGPKELAAVFKAPPLAIIPEIRG